jgi:hypothetical protein
MARGRRSSTGRSFVNAQPDGALRRSQAVTTFGPGAMMDLVKQAVLVGGLEFWGWDRSTGRTVLKEPRLRAALAPRFEALGRKLSVEAAFCEPPVSDDRSPSRGVGIQVLGSRPGSSARAETALKHRDALEPRRPYRHQCSRTTSTSACPCASWARAAAGTAEAVDLLRARRQKCAFTAVLEEGAAATSRRSSSAASCDARTRCRTRASSGARGMAWLGSEAREECDEEMRLLVRTASNSYFSQVVGALSVPDPSNELDDLVESVWDVMQAATAEAVAAFRAIPKVKTALAGRSDEDVLAAVARRKKGAAAEREAIRTAEYRQFLGSPRNPASCRPTTRTSGRGSSCLRRSGRKASPGRGRPEAPRGPRDRLPASSR